MVQARKAGTSWAECPRCGDKGMPGSFCGYCKEYISINEPVYEDTPTGIRKVREGHGTFQTTGRAEYKPLVKEPSPIEKAMAIVNQRSEEKERMYGPFSEGMKKAAIIATELCNKKLDAEDMYKILMALKLSRIAYYPGHDSLTDLIGYAEGLYNFKNNK